MKYRSINAFLKEKFGQRVYKISIDIGTTCPNRDGSKGVGGCIFCNPSSNNPAAGLNHAQKLAEGAEYLRKRHSASKFIAYFQHHSNTYGDPSKLKKYFEEALLFPDVVGLAISTRPDCISDEIVEILSDLNSRTYLWVELGLQTANDATLKFLNRGHTVDDLVSAVEKLHKNNISVCAHVILGLPNETERDILNTVTLINRLKIEGVKIHNLHILKDTKLEDMYKEDRIRLATLDEYAAMVVLFLEHLGPNVLIHRFNSHAPRDLTVAPEWSINKLATFNAVEQELKVRNSFQGKKHAVIPAKAGCCQSQNGVIASVAKQSPE